MKTKKLLLYTLLVLATFLLIGVKPVYAEKGPDNTWAAIEINGERVFDNGTVDNSIVQGITYDEDTNTLTLNNYKSSAFLSIAQMGDDFKLKLIGDNEVGDIMVNDAFDQYNTNLNITGYGSLTVNKEKVSYTAIRVYFGKLIVDETATLKLYINEGKTTSYQGAVLVYNNIEDENESIVFKNGDTPVITTNDGYKIIKSGTLTILPKYVIKVENTDLPLTVGEKPEYKASLKENKYNLKIAQTIISNPSRFSTLSSEIGPYDDYDELVRNMKYDYAIEITLQNSEGNVYDENIELYVDGVKCENFNFVDDKTFYIYMEKEITPEGYIEPAALDEYFEEEQIRDVQEKVLQAIKEGKVKYKDSWNFIAEETEEAIRNALENGDEIDVYIVVSKTIHKSILDYYFEEDETSGMENKIGKNQKLGSYYYVEIEVYVNDDIVGYVSEIETPLEVTVPLPNGLPKVADGYQRIWKMIRKHGESIDVLDAKQTENGISYEDDKYSAFAAVYEDVKVEDTKQEEATTPSKENTNNSTTSNPETDDNIVLWIGLALISFAGILGTKKISVEEKKNK